MPLEFREARNRVVLDTTMEEKEEKEEEVTEEKTSQEKNRVVK